MATTHPGAGNLNTPQEALHSLLREITVLALEEDAYVEHGVYRRSDSAASRRLDGFAADVTQVLDAPKPDA